MSQERNPFIIPGEITATTQALRCPKCGSQKFDGYENGGVVVRTCHVCGNEWSGGIGKVASRLTDPPLPPDPSERWQRSMDGKKWEENLVREPLAPAFRRGAPLPLPGEEDDV